MKLLVTLGLLVICSHAWAIETDDYFLPVDTQRTKFEILMENMKSVIANGNSSLGIPPLDPYNNKEVPIELDEDMIKMIAKLKNVNVRGLSGYNVIKGEVEIIGLKLNMSLTWPLIQARTNYTMNGNFEDFPIYGTGDMKANVEDFSFNIEIDFKIEGNYLQVKSIKSKSSLRELKFQATGLFDDSELSELLSALISDGVPPFVDENQEMITETIHPIIKEKCNGILSNITLGELIKLLG